MARSGCLTCVKYTLFVFNFIFWLVGCLLLAVGIWALVDPGPVREYATDNEWQASILIYAMITIGSIMTIIGFLGCCGAIRGSRCLLILFFVMLFIIHGIFLSVGLYLAIRREKVNDLFPEPNKDRTMDRLKHFIRDYELDAVGRKHLEEIQTKYKCCGLDKGIEDYKEFFPLMTEFPPPCNRERRRIKSCVEPVYRAERARYELLANEWPKYAIIISAIVLSISFLMIVGMILSIVLCCALKDELISTY